MDDGAQLASIPASQRKTTSIITCASKLRRGRERERESGSRNLNFNTIAITNRVTAHVNTAHGRTHFLVGCAPAAYCRSSHHEIVSQTNIDPKPPQLAAETCDLIYVGSHAIGRINNTARRICIKKNTHTQHTHEYFDAQAS